MHDLMAPVETLPRPELGRIQLERLRALVARAVRVPLHRDRLAAAGVTPDGIRALGDIGRLPFTTKADFRDTYPFGLLAAPHARDRAHPRLLRHHGEGDCRRLHARGPGRVDRGDGPDAPGGRGASGRRRAERLRVRALHGRPRLPLRRGARGRGGHPGVRRLHGAPARRLPGPRQHRALLHPVLRAPPGGGHRGGRPARGVATAPGRVLRRGAVDRGHADGDRDAPPPDGAQRLRAVGDHRPGRGRRVPRAPGHARGRGPLLPRGRRPEDPRARAARRDGRARAHDAQQAGDAAPPVPHPRPHDARSLGRAAAAGRWCASGASWRGPTTC